MTPALIAQARTVLDQCRVRGIMIATAESCTGGLVAATLTEIAGSSAVVDCGFVTYSNEAKQMMLGVSAITLRDHGAVSQATAEEMVVGVLTRSRATIAVSITGIAGPGSDNTLKPVGLVHLAAANRTGRLIHREHRFGEIGRDSVRLGSVSEALRLLDELARA